MRVVSGLLAAIGIGPGATNSPVTPASPSTLIGALQLIRRELEHTFNNKAPNLPDTPISLTVNEGSSKSIIMPATDADGDVLTYSVPAKGQPGGPGHGTATVTGNTITYTPDPGYTPAPGSTHDDTFTITASDANSGFHLHGLASLLKPATAHTDTERVNVDIQSPIAKDDAPTVAEDSGATIIDVLANDAGPSQITAVTQPAHGTVAFTATTLTYKPNANFFTTTGPDTFTYTLNGGSTATVAVTVTAVDDAPAAANDAPTVAEDSAATIIDVLSNDADIDAGPKQITGVTQPAHGTVAFTATTLTYKPDANFFTIRHRSRHLHLHPQRRLHRHRRGHRHRGQRSAGEKRRAHRLHADHREPRRDRTCVRHRS